MKTIELQGKNYAPVNERIKEAHKSDKLSIITSVECFDKEKLSFMFTAVVSNEKGEYTAHSMVSIKWKKDFEKGETIAVGRALAYAGYITDGSVASYEEMKDFIEKNNND